VRYTRRWQKLLLGAVILSFWTSGLLRAYAWMALLGDSGIINKGLKSIGLIDAPLPFLLFSPFAVVLVMTYFCLPFAVITIYASLEKMDWSWSTRQPTWGRRQCAPLATSRCRKPCPAWRRPPCSPSCR
jgi:spermidine/putrescine transport system permease protein